LTPINIALVELSGVLHDVIRGVVEGHTDLKVVADISGRDGVARTVAETDAHFVIWQADGEFGDSFPDLVEQMPRLKVLAVENEGRRSFLWEMRPTRARLGELSPDRLICALRAAEGT
jgi:hypothetical protein